MSVALKDLSEKLNISQKELIAKINELGFEVSTRAKKIDEELAQLIEDELKKDDEDLSTAEVYEEMINQELEREIVKKQRKMTAGKDKGDKVSRSQGQHSADNKKNAIEIDAMISVKEFAEKANISAAKIIGQLMKNGILSNINQKIDYDSAAIIAEELGVKIKKKRIAGSVDDIMAGDLTELLKEEDSADLIERPAIVSVMGHVDHGKTKLLDTIRQANVIDTEAGGITQHIGAYQVQCKGKMITFLDTPGHEAFTAMRARGAKVTDIAILIVAADEGVKPQTVEALNHAKEAKTPIIVAINKIDREGANIEKVKGELAEHGLQPEDWGGDVPMVPISALKNEGIDNLLDNIIVLSEVLELRANPARPAVGTVVESHMEPGFGPVATILVNTGTLRLMDHIVVGETYGRVKAMFSHKGKRLQEVSPSGAVKIAGLNKCPHTGDILQVMPDEKSIKAQALELVHAKEFIDARKRGMGVDEIIARINEGELKTLKVVLKVDTKGSLEAVKAVMARIRNEDVAVKIIHSGVGDITESDIMMASASKGIVVGFHNQAKTQVNSLAERENVEILIYDIIYKLEEELTKLVSGLLEPEILTVELGKAKVKAIFWTKRNEYVLGCEVTEGIVVKKVKVRVLRGEEELGLADISALKRVNEDVKEMKSGSECGIRLISKIKIEEGDILIPFRKEKKIKTL